MQFAAKKKQRVDSSSRLSSLTDRPPSNPPPPPRFIEQQLRRVEFVEIDSDGASWRSRKAPSVFNDPSTADVVLFLHPQLLPSPDTGNVEAEPTLASKEAFLHGHGQNVGSKEAFLHGYGHGRSLANTEASLHGNDQTLASTTVFLHSHTLQQCPYFATVLSERWQEAREFSEGPNHGKRTHVNMTIPASRGTKPYLLVIQMLYSKDFRGLISDVPTALACLPVAAEWLYDECIAACVQYLEAVPWTEDEERKVLEVVTSLQLRESAQLLARIVPINTTAVEDMLGGLVYAATHSPSNGATVKAFVAKLLHDHASRFTVKLVLDNAFANSLKIVQDSVEAYSSPNVHGKHDEIDEIEALQRMNLHTASVNGKHLLWLVERMIELRVADMAVTEWSEQSVFTANLQRAFDDDAWRNVAPSLLALVLRCTCRLANAVVTGTILASCQIRKKLVKYWLPVLLVSRGSSSPAAFMLKPLHQELEDVFLRIISTLPLGDAQTLLPQCLSFATRSMEECPHLMAAFNVWFRRAGTMEVSGNAHEGEGFA
eukprot:c15976_g1_i1 orf=183-1811(+)